MADLLVKLYDLPPLAPALAALESSGVELRRAIAPEKLAVTAWVAEHFTRAWAGECEIAFTRQPISCFLAMKEGEPCGFSCYDVTSRGFFGPIGLREDCRGRNIGTALLLAALHALHAEGYAYGIIGWAGPVEFFTRTVGAIPIEGSEPGIFRGLWNPPPAT